jgi:hypothetical protein
MLLIFQWATQRVLQTEPWMAVLAGWIWLLLSVAWMTRDLAP